MPSVIRKLSVDKVILRVPGMPGFELEISRSRPFLCFTCLGLTLYLSSPPWTREVRMEQRLVAAFLVEAVVRAGARIAIGV